MSNELLKTAPEGPALEDPALETSQLDANKATGWSLAGRMKHWRAGWGKRWALLQGNQVLYVVALVLFFLVEGDLEKPSEGLWFVGFLALFGMSRELWAIFVKVWESTLGRLVLLVSYAAIANFTLAIAAQKVNEVIGADPTYLYHTQGLTVLLILPLWIMMASVAAMVITFGVLQVLKLITGLLRLVKVLAKDKKPKEAFPKTFIIIRLILLVPVITTLSYSSAWYAEQLNLPKNSGFNFNSANAEFSVGTREQVTKVGLAIIDDKLNDPLLTPDQKNDLEKAKQDILADLVEKGVITASDTVADKTDVAVKIANATLAAGTETPVVEVKASVAEAETLVTETETPAGYFFDKLIASFVYNFEAFQYSHCTKTINERVVYISEDHVLVVTKDDTLDIAYAFSTRECIALSTTE